MTDVRKGTEKAIPRDAGQFQSASARPMVRPAPARAAPGTQLADTAAQRTTVRSPSRPTVPEFVMTTAHLTVLSIDIVLPALPNIKGQFDTGGAKHLVSPPTSSACGSRELRHSARQCLGMTAKTIL